MSPKKTAKKITKVKVTTELVSFRVDTLALLVEITDNALAPKMGVLQKPINIFKNLLAEVAERAIQINDPELNILMLRLALYNTPPKDIAKAIQQQRARINKVKK